MNTKGETIMKKFFSTLLVLALVLSLTCAALAASVHAVASPTYVRTGPGLGYAIVDSLSAGSYYTWGGNTSYDSRGVAWYDVYYYGGYGWVSSLHANLDYGDAELYSERGWSGSDGGTQIYAGSHEVNVRSGPGTNYARIGTMYPGQSFDYTGYSQNGFYQIVFYDQTGWVSSQWTYKN